MSCSLRHVQCSRAKDQGLRCSAPSRERPPTQATPGTCSCDWRNGPDWSGACTVHPRGLRHTHAADLALAGVPVLAIQKRLGHTSLVTTSHYLRRVGVKLDVAKSIRG
ncbi:MAG: tyrosine-type recombinase/integrase [Nannocystales bacterium]